MRWMILAAAAAALVAPALTVAQSRGASTCSQGQLTRIRLSKITPDGSMAGFRAAVAAHTAWYRVHGYHIDQRIAPVVTFAGGGAEDTGGRSYRGKRTYGRADASAGYGGSSQEVMTFVTSDDVPREKHDAAWNAFVAKYRANSQIERETIVCMPR